MPVGAGPTPAANCPPRIVASRVRVIGIVSRLARLTDQRYPRCLTARHAFTRLLHRPRVDGASWSFLRHPRLAQSGEKRRLGQGLRLISVGDGALEAGD